MHTDLFPAADAAARAAAAFIAAEARAAVRERGRFVLAVSGGRTPAPMFAALSREEVPWEGVHLFQVDERIAPMGHADRNLTSLRETLISHVPLPEAQIYPMPVDAGDLNAAATDYQRKLSQIAGSPPTLDLVHLGLGRDGHTASLLPGDAALGVEGDDVAVTGEYEGRRRMTLTIPILNRSRQIVWLVTGPDKAAMLARLLTADTSIPAGRVSQAHAHVFACTSRENDL